MYELFISKPDALPAQWLSFGRLIGDRTEQVTIANLVAVVRPDVAIPQLAAPTVTDKMDTWMAIYIASIYRIQMANWNDYKTKIAEHVQTAMSRNGSTNAVTALTLIGNYESFIKDKWFCALIAVIDMFLAKFPTHDLAPVRVGTLTTRLKDCSIITALAYIHDLTKMDSAELGKWIWDPNVANEIMAVLTAGNEIDVPNSYKPYFMSMG